MRIIQLSPIIWYGDRRILEQTYTQIQVRPVGDASWVIRTPLCRLCGRLDDLISEPTRAVGATVTAGTVTLIGLPRMAR